MNVLSLSRTGDDRYVGGSGQAPFGLKSCNLAIQVSGARLRTAYDGNGRSAAWQFP